MFGWSSLAAVSASNWKRSRSAALNDLQGHRAVQARLPCPVDDPHAAAAHHLQERELPELPRQVLAHRGTLRSCGLQEGGRLAWPGRANSSASCTATHSARSSSARSGWSRAAASTSAARPHRRASVNPPRSAARRSSRSAVGTGESGMFSSGPRQAERMEIVTRRVVADRDVGGREGKGSGRSNPSSLCGCWHLFGSSPLPDKWIALQPPLSSPAA